MCQKGKRHCICLPLIVLIITLICLCVGSYGDEEPNFRFQFDHFGHRPTTFAPTFGVSHHNNPNSAAGGNLFNYYNTNQIWSSLARARALKPKVVNVDAFGAKADGGDDSQAFKKAWKYACSSSQGAVLVVPKKKIYHVKPIDFSGPCKSALVFKVYGTIKASVHHSDYKERKWLYFDNVENLRVEGGGSGTINGNGRTWCPARKRQHNVQVGGVRIKNAQQMHLTFRNCFNVKASNLLVKAPGNSPNTDGIHVSGTQNIIIQNSVIATGDDCISIVSGSKNVRATGITCGPGHGISIGSLGAKNSEAYVSNVIVDKATLSGTTNGVRIKTWQGGSGYAKNIKFRNIMMHNVSNPIIIDQNYCDQRKPCSKQVSAVQVSNVVYQNIRGTSASDVALKLDCSQSFPCRGIYLQNVDLSVPQNQHNNNNIAEASCSNVRLTYQGNVSPPCST
ncbi:Glycoside hydrolase, family 28 [Corchorus olitorius]|uniref:Glycoside hydrolase, family 28 n=1 Tax=Corchorus olitorius TaxID=93759 RepID=A0A1R3KSL5_9ROSI|nr:Glycoside hydrolase, family 28 [Corchorus olitorius]